MGDADFLGSFCCCTSRAMVNCALTCWPGTNSFRPVAMGPALDRIVWSGAVLALVLLVTTRTSPFPLPWASPWRDVEELSPRAGVARRKVAPVWRSLAGPRTWATHDMANLFPPPPFPLCRAVLWGTISVRVAGSRSPMRLSDTLTESAEGVLDFIHMPHETGPADSGIRAHRRDTLRVCGLVFQT